MVGIQQNEMVSRYTDSMEPSFASPYTAPVHLMQGLFKPQNAVPFHTNHKTQYHFTQTTKRSTTSHKPQNAVPLHTKHKTQYHFTQNTKRSTTSHKPQNAVPLHTNHKTQYHFTQTTKRSTTSHKPRDILRASPLKADTALATE